MYFTSKGLIKGNWVLALCLHIKMGYIFATIVLPGYEKLATDEWLMLKKYERNHT